MANLYKKHLTGALRPLLDDPLMGNTDLSEEIPLVRSMFLGSVRDLNEVPTGEAVAIFDMCLDRLMRVLDLQQKIERSRKADSVDLTQLVGGIMNAVSEAVAQLNEERELGNVIDADMIGLRICNEIERTVTPNPNKGISRLPSDDVREMDATVPIFDEPPSTNGHSPTNGVA